MSETLDAVADRTERSLLGSLLRNNEHIAEVLVVVMADDFRSDRHQRIMRAIESLFRRGQPADLVTLAEELRDQIEDIGGYDYLATLYEGEATGAMAVYYARRVLEHSTRRQLRYVGEGLIRAAEHPTGPVEDMLAEAERQIFAVADRGTEVRARPLSDLLTEARDRIDRTVLGELPPGTPTGFIEIDTRFGILHDGELTIIAARPACGKTSFALCLARNVARGAHPILFVSLEQRDRELIDRLLCADGRVSLHKLRHGLIDAGDVSRLVTAAQGLDSVPMFVADAPQQSILQIAANARRIKARVGLGLIVVDYLQLIEPEDPRAKRYEQVGAVSRRLKVLARDLNVPVVALAQLSRAADGERPRLAHLRESGSIEQDADVVAMLHRPSATDQPERVGEVDVLIEKHRSGPTGSVTVRFRAEHLAFEDLLPDYPTPSADGWH